MDEINEKLLKAKVETDFRETMKNTKKLIKLHTDNIPKAEELDDHNKGQWVEHDLENFKEVFNGLLDYCNDEGEYDNGSLDWNSVNYVPYNHQWYEEKFPGFDPAVYHILEQSTDPESRIVDTRIPPFKCIQEERTITFD